MAGLQRRAPGIHNPAASSLTATGGLPRGVVRRRESADQTTLREADRSHQSERAQAGEIAPAGATGRRSGLAVAHARRGHHPQSVPALARSADEGLTGGDAMGGHRPSQCRRPRRVQVAGGSDTQITWNDEKAWNQRMGLATESGL
jgi:hypothetical protein